jgi:hypothetical protein
MELRELVRRLVRLRHETPSLRRGDFLALPTSSGSGIYAFARKLGEEALALAINPSDGTRTAGVRVGPLGWADGAEVADLLGPTRRAVERGAIRLRLAPYSGALLKRVR